MCVGVTRICCCQSCVLCLPNNVPDANGGSPTQQWHTITLFPHLRTVFIYLVGSREMNEHTPYDRACACRIVTTRPACCAIGDKITIVQVQLYYVPYYRNVVLRSFHNIPSCTLPLPNSSIKLQLRQECETKKQECETILLFSLFRGAMAIF